ncbi:MAG: inositol monophosphatase family protein [Cytophagales bacterium]|nr:inositol monophosphatase [Bernardetiaceae bacterium]MDW8203613.1 inositol monophosphatase family protein [Cytophagales bacterium]
MELQTLCQAVVEIAHRAGSFIRHESELFQRSLVEEKGRNNLVSYVDKQAEQIIVEHLSILLPQAGFIAEEGTGSHLLKGLNWVVDPLDGTTNFIHGVPPYAVSIALVDNEDVLLGVVQEVFSGECFHAIKGGGAWLGTKPLRVSAEQELAKGLIATGFAYDTTEIDHTLAVLKQLLIQTHGFRRLGSAAIDLAYVAAGRFEAFYEKNLNPWDVAAGILLVKEAGGIVSDFHNGSNFLFGKEIVASCTPLLHHDLLKTIQVLRMN